ncbi:MAG TPA: transglutaminase-like domain-containing protein [Candidatus Hypogeohydataceae bacterium YC40]
MTRFRPICISFLLLLIAPVMSGCTGGGTAPIVSQQRQALEDMRPRRSFEFVYSAKISHLPQRTGVALPPRGVRVWFPVPQCDDNQEISLIEIKAPSAYTLHKEPVYNNEIAFFELRGALPQEIDLEMRFRATRYEDRKEVDPEFPHEKAIQFLQPSRLGAIIPEVEDIATRIRNTRRDSQSQMHEAYNYVLNNMEYKKEGTGWGRGDTRWACSARYGNCTDYHALFIALAQTLGTPAVFEIGFPISQDKKEGIVSGYHCWAHFYLKEKGWVPIDASEAYKNPSKREYFFGAHDTNRVKFTTGRDIWLVPRQKGEPLNYFIYPYVEVDGIPHEEMELEFSFKDL